MVSAEGQQGRSSEHQQEVQQLRLALAQNQIENQELRQEFEAFRHMHYQKAQLWESGAQHLVHLVERFLSAQFGLRPTDREEVQKSRFGRTAKKLSLTLPSKGEGSDVGSLRKMLKDLLKNDNDPAGHSQHARADETSSNSNSNEESQPQKPGSEPRQGTAESTAPSATAAAACSAEATKAAAASSSSSPDSTATSTPVLQQQQHPQQQQQHQEQHQQQRPHAKAGEASSDSNPSSRETSPSRGTHVPGQYDDGHVSLPDAKVAQFAAEVSNHLRQLLAMSHTTVPPHWQHASTAFAQDLMKLALGNHAAAPGDQQKLQQYLEDISPARQAITQNVIALECALRIAVRDLKAACKDLFGNEDFQGETTGEASSSQETTVPSTEALRKEALTLFPLTEEQQLLSLTSLRRTQANLKSALQEFLHLPQKLKKVFDLIKALAHEANSLVPSALLEQAQLQVAVAKQEEQRYKSLVESLHQRCPGLFPLSPGPCSTSPAPGRT